MLKISRQGYYQAQKRETRNLLAEDLVIQEVQDIRDTLPKCGVRKLHHMLKEKGFNIGRDRLFDILRENGMLVERTRKYPAKGGGGTRYNGYANLLHGMEFERPYQAIVADITYIDTYEGWTYLALVTDRSRRKILGWDLSSSLEVSGSLRALKMALRGCESDLVIHHSDRGTQYSSNQYTNYLKKKGIWISMSAKGNPYENAVAERVNGILKQEFGLDKRFKNLDDAKKAARQAIQNYNNKRPHMSLGYKTPNEAMNAA